MPAKDAVIKERLDVLSEIFLGELKRAVLRPEIRGSAVTSIYAMAGGLSACLNYIDPNVTVEIVKGKKEVA